jgi:hypothetical protein
MRAGQMSMQELTVSPTCSCDAPVRSISDSASYDLVAQAQGLPTRLGDSASGVDLSV